MSHFENSGTYIQSEYQSFKAKNNTFCQANAGFCLYIPNVLFCVIHKPYLNIIFFEASDKFRKWNEYYEICYFPHQKDLLFFPSYFQDNCKRECAWNRLVDFFYRFPFLLLFFRSISVCGCAPRYLHLKGVMM